jgi:hypothetical protein
MSRTDTAVRVISASPDRVFAALTDSDALALWLPQVCVHIHTGPQVVAQRPYPASRVHSRSVDLEYSLAAVATHTSIAARAVSALAKYSSTRSWNRLGA